MLTESGSKREAVAVAAQVAVVLECAVGALVLLGVLLGVLYGVAFT